MAEIAGLILEPELDGWGFEEGCTVTHQGKHVVISVAEECAVDSYNASFTCKITLKREQVEKMRDWLNEYLELSQ